MKLNANQNILALSRANVDSVSAEDERADHQRERSIRQQQDDLDRLESPLTVDVDDANEVDPSPRTIRVHTQPAGTHSSMHASRVADRSSTPRIPEGGEGQPISFVDVLRRQGFRRAKEFSLEEAEQSGEDNDGDVAAGDLSFRKESVQLLKGLLLVGRGAAKSLTRFQWVYVLVIVPLGILFIMASLILFT